MSMFEVTIPTVDATTTSRRGGYALWILFLSHAPTLLLPWLLTGCGGVTARQCHPVQGKVIYQNQPLAEAMVVFHPLISPTERVPQPIGHTDIEGRFVITTLQSGDGAPAGEYAITIELREPRQIGEEVVRDGPNLLPPKYASPQDTPLRYKVIPGKNEVPEIQVE
jgi:hypothetical protein